MVRRKNSKLGYGNDENNWSRIAYENSIRNLLRKDILKNTKKFGRNKYK